MKHQKRKENSLIIMRFQQLHTMMLIMMNLHGRSINVGLKRLEGIVQIRHGISVGGGRNSNGGGQSGGLLKDFTTGVGRFCVENAWVERRG